MAEQLASLLQADLPWWASAFAAVLLALAAAIARRIGRHSARPQGERLGTIEQEFRLEQTRRRQVEQLLRAEYSVDLPWWPPDGDPPPPRPRYRDEDDDEDQGDDGGPQTAIRPEIPPLPDYSHHRR